MGEGDRADLETAKQAYSIVRGSIGAETLTHWDSLPERMRSALQFVVAHATLNEREACAKIAAAMYEKNTEDDWDVAGRKIADAIRDQST